VNIKKFSVVRDRIKFIMSKVPRGEHSDRKIMTSEVWKRISACRTQLVQPALALAVAWDGHIVGDVGAGGC
jgi:hypothetical protein